MSKPKPQGETAQERAFAEVAQARMLDYQKRWAPLQAKLAEDVQSMGKADSFERRRAAGKSSTDSAIRFNEAKQGVEAGLTNVGAGPGSSKFKLAVTGVGADEATSRGLGIAASDQAIDDSYIEGLGKIAAMGRGEAQGAIRGMGEVGQMAARQAASDAELSAQHRAGNAALVGQVAGFGLSGGFAPLGNGATPTNDIKNVNGGNAMDRFFQFGSGGD